MRKWELPSIVVSKKGARKICEILIRVRKFSDIINIINLLEKSNVKIVSMNASYKENEHINVHIFTDISELKVPLTKFIKNIGKVTFNSVSYKVLHADSHFVSSELLFPIYTLSDERVLIILEKDFSRMLKNIYEVLGDVGRSIIYHLAFAGGKSLASGLKKKLYLPKKKLILEAFKLYQAIGWAKIKVEKLDIITPNIVFKAYDSIECKAFKGSNKATSHFIRGHIEGLLSEILGYEVSVEEVECIAKGDPFCRFHVKRLRGSEI